MPSPLIVSVFKSSDSGSGRNSLSFLVPLCLLLSVAGLDRAQFSATPTVVVEVQVYFAFSGDHLSQGITAGIF